MAERTSMAGTLIPVTEATTCPFGKGDAGHDTCRRRRGKAAAIDLEHAARGVDRYLGWGDFGGDCREITGTHGAGILMIEAEVVERVVDSLLLPR
jgi:hypothetical protein